MDIQVSFAPKPKVVEGAMVVFTEAAAIKVKALVEEEKNPNLKLRVSVDGGGCSGFQYVWGLSKEATHERIKWSPPISDILLLDPMAEMYIFGSEIDYVTELGASFLRIVNPTATAQCGCGESFGV